MSFRKKSLFIAKLILIIVSLIGPLSMAHDGDNHPDEEESDSQYHDITKGKNPKLFPLASVDSDGCSQLKLKSLEFRSTKFIIKNISDKQVKIKSIKAGCPCLELAKPMNDIDLAAGATVPVEFTIRAKELKVGSFRRLFYIDVDGCKPCYMPISGDITEFLQYEPSPIVQLGTFIGDVYWERAFTIKSLLEEDNLILESPKDDSIFDVEVKKISPKTFKVIVATKNSMPIRQLKESIRIPISGIQGFDPVLIGIKGRITGWVFDLEKKTIILDNSRVSKDKPIVVEGKVIHRSPENSFHEKMRRQNDEKDPNITILPVADKEEKSIRPLSSPETWKPHLKLISVENLPANATLEKLPVNGGIILKITIPAGFFKTENQSLNLPVKARGKTISELNIIAP